MHNDYEVRTGDAPTIEREIPGNLTQSGASVVFSLEPIGSNTPVVDEATVTVGDGSYDGEKDTTVVSYTLDSTDLSTAGDYVAEFEATYADGEVLSFPQGRYIYISVEEDI